MMRTRLITAAAVLAAVVPLAAVPASAAPAPQPGTRMLPVPPGGPEPLSAPQASEADELPAPSQCRKEQGAPCYTTDRVARAYGMDTAHRLGMDGEGATIAIVLPHIAPDAPDDLAEFSRAMGLPEPDLTVVQAPGKVREIDPDDPQEAAIGAEQSMNLQAAHAMAPRAELLLVQTPLGEGWGWAGAMDGIFDGMAWAARHYPVDVILMSHGIAEGEFAERDGDYTRIHRLRAGLQAVAEQDVTMLAATGNIGPAGFSAGGGFLPDQQVIWPASDPLVTAVGGTDLDLDDGGRRLGPDRVWQAEPNGPIEMATGGGLSRVFDRPDYQDPVADVAGDKRAVPDVAAVAGGHSRVWFVIGGHWRATAGTSVATPLMGGIVAAAAAEAGGPLGNINPALYGRGPARVLGLYDLKSGTNAANGFEGYRARRGYDAASGQGTPVHGALLVTRLALAA